MSFSEAGHLLAGVSALVVTYGAILIETRRRRHGFRFTLWDAGLWGGALLLWYAALGSPFSR